MTDCLRVAIAQLNPTVGDLAGNLALVRKARAEAAAQHADLVVTTELVMTGYPPEDLVLRQAFQDDVAQAVRDLASDTGDTGPAIIVGVPWRVDGRLHNAALLLADGDLAAQVNKFDLPNYGVFDEKRVFTPGPVPVPVEWRGHRLGVMVCEDMWTPVPAKALASAGAEQLIVINGSPYEHDKSDERLALARERVRETGLPLIYANQIGGQDEIVFDGASFVVNADGAVAIRLSSWREGGRRHRMGNRRVRADGRVSPEMFATWPTALKACIRRWLRVSGITCKRTGSPVWSWAFPVGSIQPCRRPWPSMRWARKTCAA